MSSMQPSRLASSTKRRLRAHARAQLARALGDALPAPLLDALDERLFGPPALPTDAIVRESPKQRLQSILRSDRDGASETASAGAEQAGAGDPDGATGAADQTEPAPQRLEGTCDEPVRTRSMARLLASQGHPDRAVAIYEALLAMDSADAALRAELEAARALCARGVEAGSD